MTWQILTALTVLFLSVSILVQRVLLYKYKTDPIAFSVLFQIIVSLLLAIAAAAHGFSLAGFANVWIIALACIVFFGVGTVVYAKTLQIVEASVFSVLFATHAIWVMLIGVVLLGESLTIMQIAGSALIFISVGLLVNESHLFRLDKGTALGLLTGVLYGFATACTAYIGRHIDTLSWVTLSFAGSAFVSFLVRPRSIYKIKPMFSPAILSKITLLGVLYAVGSLTLVLAYKYGSFSVVSPLRQTGIIVTVLLALLFLKPERNRIVRKLTAAFVCFAGVVLIVI